MKTKLVVAGAVLALIAHGAVAQNKKIFRCEDANGRVTYSDEVCRGGLELKNADERSAGQRDAAAGIVKREEAMATKMARERRAAEKTAASSGAAHIPHSAAEQAAQDKPAAKKTTTKKKTVVVQTQAAVQR